MRFFLCLLFLPVFALAQSLPKPAAVVYRCQIDGKTVYSDDPCPGAKVVKVTPNSGVDRLSGKSVVGQDIRQERFRQQIGEAVEPITGMSSDRFSVEVRRVKLSPEQKRTCNQLDEQMPVMVKQEAISSGQELQVIQNELYKARVRYRGLGC